MCRRQLLALILGLALAPGLVAQTDKTDRFIRSEMERQNIPGLSLAILKDGEIVKVAGYGVSDRARGTPATPETVYKIASVSKTFISAGVLVLVQDGQLALEDPIHAHLEHTPPAWASITVRHLLAHTAGLAREAPGFDTARVQSDADVIATAHPLPLLTAPGEAAEYSNLGYFVLAELIHVVSGQPWSEFIEDRVFRPAGMSSTRTTAAAPQGNRAQGYIDNDRLLEAPDWPALRPSGAFVSTVLDLARWERAMTTGAVLSERTRHEMWAPVRLADGSDGPFGLGWQIGDTRERRLVFHLGGLPGFRAAYVRYPDDGLTVIALMNLNDVDPLRIIGGVANLYLP